VLDRMARIMEHDGYLVLGAAETVVGLTDSFKPLPDRRGVYVPSKSAKGGKGDVRPGLRLVATAR
jgi:chemotaxis protein methyltransferase CheR